MKPKQYQTRVLDELGDFLTALADSHAEYKNIIAQTPLPAREAVANNYDFVGQAWQQTNGIGYFSQKDGLGNWLPDVYLKVPTGGGKTLLACHAIDRIHRQYLNRQAGLVLWVVPTTQIYRQTIEKLSDRSHPYRQILDIASGGHTIIKERGKPLKPADINGNLVVLMLMLPAAARQSKETLRMFKDSGGYDSFFPAEDDYESHKQLLQQINNLDTFEDADGILPQIVKSSLGNVIKICRPLMIVDEGQKAYSPLSRETLRNFNPAFVLELSATPPPNTSIISAVSGKELDEEEMIKLDIHLKNTPTDWKDTLLAAINKRAELEKAADKFRQNSNRYIRPIALIQAERTGKDQRSREFVHAEDVKEFLITQSGIRPEHIAIKSSTTDDIENTDLLSEECPVRYIITKSALQEGWDCAFAYVLATLTNPNSQTAMTQLVGRILRQPYAQKIKDEKFHALNECYVFARRKNAGDLINNIKKELKDEGLGDLSGRLSTDGKDAAPKMIMEAKIRDKFQQFDGRIYLPQFVMIKNNKVRKMDYCADILGNIPWQKIRPHGLETIVLGDNDNSTMVKINLPRKEIKTDDEMTAGGLEVDSVFMTRQLVDVVPNAWRAHEISEEILQYFTAKDGQQKTAANFVYIIEQSKKLLTEQRDKLAKQTFNKLIEKGELRFVLLTGKGGWKIPPKIKTYDDKKLVRENQSQIEKSLFDGVRESDFNTLEKEVAICMDNQRELLWWYRNRSRTDYRIQGWKPNGIYPDFIAAKDDGNNGIDKVAVVEIKGLHLKNEDTKYKQSVFEMCNKMCKSLTAHDLDNNKTAWQKLNMNFADNKFYFQVVHEDEWQSVLNGIFAPS